MAMPEDHLQKVQSIAESALIRAGAVRRCEHHKDVLLYNVENQEGPVPFKIASIWLKQADVMFMREDLQDAIKGILDGAAKDGCPECAQERSGREGRASEGGWRMNLDRAGPRQQATRLVPDRRASA